MKHNRNHIKNESASFNMPKKEERKKGKYEDFITKLMGRIFLTKKTFFGLDEQKIVVIVTPSLKIANILASPTKQLSKFPFENRTPLDGERLINWANENDYVITFATPLPSLKLNLRHLFGDVIVTESTNKKTDIDFIIEEVKNSFIPESLKEWVTENPEKFIKKLNEVKKRLK